MHWHLLFLCHWWGGWPEILQTSDWSAPLLLDTSKGSHRATSVTISLRSSHLGRGHRPSPHPGQGTVSSPGVFELPQAHRRQRPPDLDVHLIVAPKSPTRSSAGSPPGPATPSIHPHLLLLAHIIPRKAIRRDSFSSVAQLKEKILHFAVPCNAGAQLFLWTATADSILQKIQDYVYLSPVQNTRQHRPPFP